MKSQNWRLAVLAAGLVSASVAGAQAPQAASTQSAAPAQTPAATQSQSPAPAPAAVGPDVCISDAARTEITSCHQGAVSVNWLERSGQQQRQAAQVRTVARPQQQQQRRPVQLAGVDPLATLEGDRQARSLAILRQEIQALTALVQTTRRDAADRPEVIGRLAETYTEFQAALRNASGALDEVIFCLCPETTDSNCQQDHPTWPAASQPACDEKTQQKEQLERDLAQAYQASNATLAMLIRDHPNYPQLDRIMFSLAYGLDRVGQTERAQQVYLALAERFPTSRYVPHAFLAFGEYFFNNNMMDDAQAAYERVLAFGQENNAVYGYAIFKLAWVFYNKNEYEQSLARFEEALRYGLDNPRSLAADQMVSETRRNIVMPYAQVRGPERALRDFMGYSNNDRAMAYRMYEELTLFYYDSGMWANAINGFKVLIRDQSTSEKICWWQSQIVDATMRSRPKADTVAAMNELVSVYERFTADENQPLEARNQCKAGTASVLYVLATQWHVEAVGGVQGADGSNNGGAGVGREVQGTRSRDTMTQAANLYELLLRSFPDLEQLDFSNSHINREDYPSRYRIAYYYADLLYQAEDWRRCGPAFELVTSINPQGEYTNDAAGAAVRCYIRVYETDYASSEGQVGRRQEETQQQPANTNTRRGGRRGGRNQPAEATPPPPAATTNSFERRPYTQLEEGMLRAFSNYMCVASDNAEDLLVIKFRRARIYYESNHFEEAALMFRDYALNHKGNYPNDEYAANLYFDSLNVLASQQQPVRPACLSTLETDSQQICSMYCSTDADRSRYGDLCPVCANIECSVKRQRAESFHNAGRFIEAGNAYLDIVELNSARPEGQQCGAIPELLYNAAIDFETGYQIGQAIYVRGLLIDTYPTHELAQKAIYLTGANFHAIAWYDNAAQWYERFAREFPNADGSNCRADEVSSNRCPIAHSALMNATLFRLGLGQIDQAKADADLFARNYARTKPYEVARVQYAIGSYYEHREQWDQVVLYYSKYLRDYGRTAPPHLLLQAHALRGRAYRLEGRSDRHREMIDSYTQAARLWDANRIAEGLDRLQVPVGERARILQDTVNAAAEAFFYLAEEKFTEVQAIRFPAYSGGANDQRIMQWIQREFLPWGQRRSAAVQAAIVEYNKVRNVKVNLTVEGNAVEIYSPPWQTAAARRTGQMFREVVDAFRNVPVPEVVDQNPELYEIYIGALEGQAEPLLNQARDAFLFCLNQSTSARWFSSWSRECEEELARIDPAQYPPAVELRGANALDFVTPPWPGAASLGSGANTAAAASGASNASGAAAPAASGTQGQ